MRTIVLGGQGPLPAAPTDQPTGTPPPRVVIVTAAMGGGHLQLSDELRRRLVGWGCGVDIVDLLDLMPGRTGHLLGRTYPLMVNHAPHAYGRSYDLLIRNRPITGRRLPIPTNVLVSRLRRVLQQRRPALVISTYPLASLAVGSLKSSGDLTCPAATMITTFSVNDLWLHLAMDAELCISMQAAEDVRRRTGRLGQVCGPIVRPGFRRRRTPAGREHRLSHHVALVTTGSVGLVGSAVQAALTIAAQPGWRAVVLCGHDDRLRARLAGQRDVEALSWVEDMASVMATADVLVDNAAGMSSKEALGMGLPIVTFRPIPGNGSHDTAALARLGLTDVTDTPQELMAALDRLVGDGRHRASRIARGQALFVDEPLAVLSQLIGRTSYRDAA